MPARALANVTVFRSDIDGVVVVRESGAACVADRQRDKRGLVEQGNRCAANGQRAARAGDAGLVFEAGALDVIMRAAVLHEQVGLDLVAVAEGIGNANGAEAIERESLIRGDDAGDRTMRPGAKLGPFGKNHIGCGDNPGFAIALADLNQAAHRDDVNCIETEPPGWEDASADGPGGAGGPQGAAINKDGEIKPRTSLGECLRIACEPFLSLAGTSAVTGCW